MEEDRGEEQGGNSARFFVGSPLHPNLPPFNDKTGLGTAGKLALGTRRSSLVNPLAPGCREQLRLAAVSSLPWEPLSRLVSHPPPGAGLPSRPALGHARVKFDQPPARGRRLRRC